MLQILGHVAWCRVKKAVFKHQKWGKWDCWITSARSVWFGKFTVTQSQSTQPSSYQPTLKLSRSSNGHFYLMNSKAEIAPTHQFSSHSLYIEALDCYQPISIFLFGTNSPLLKPFVKISLFCSFVSTCCITISPGFKCNQNQ
jgi:hypothetical protein